MKPLLRSLVIATSLLFTGAAIGEDAKEPTPPSWLFVQTAGTAEVTSEGTLLVPVVRDILGFTDRPSRLHYYANAREFGSHWDEGGSFDEDPPNAVLTWVDADGIVHEAEILMTGAEVIMHGRAIAYEVEVEAGESLVSGTISGVSLFIDSLTLSCTHSWCGNTDVAIGNGGFRARGTWVGLLQKNGQTTRVPPERTFQQK